MYVKHFFNVDFLLYFRNSSQKPSHTSEQVNKIYPNVAADRWFVLQKSWHEFIDRCVYPDRFQGKGKHQIADLQVRRLSLRPAATISELKVFLHDIRINTINTITEHVFNFSTCLDILFFNEWTWMKMRVNKSCEALGVCTRCTEINYKNDYYFLKVIQKTNAKLWLWKVEPFWTRRF